MNDKWMFMYGSFPHLLIILLESFVISLIFQLLMQMLCSDKNPFYLKSLHSVITVQSPNQYHQWSQKMEISNTIQHLLIYLI